MIARIRARDDKSDLKRSSYHLEKHFEQMSRSDVFVLDVDQGSSNTGLLLSRKRALNLRIHSIFYQFWFVFLDAGEWNRKVAHITDIGLIKNQVVTLSYLEKSAGARSFYNPIEINNSYSEAMQKLTKLTSN